MALLRARESTMRAFRLLLAEHDLTEQQWRVLRALAASSEPMDVGAIATRTFLLGSSLSRILANLERRDLVGRSTPAGDRRSYLIDRTAAGHRLMARFSPRGEAVYAQIEQQFGTDRLRRLLAELHNLADLDFTGSAGEPGET